MPRHSIPNNAESIFEIMNDCSEIRLQYQFKHFNSQLLLASFLHSQLREVGRSLESATNKARSINMGS